MTFFIMVALLAAVILIVSLRSIRQGKEAVVPSEPAMSDSDTGAVPPSPEDNGGAGIEKKPPRY